MQIQYKYKYKYKQSNPITSDPPPHLYNEVTKNVIAMMMTMIIKTKKKLDQNRIINGDNYCIQITKE